MKFLITLILFFAFCTPSFATESPNINIPPGLRQGNWVGPLREGSCVHATMVMLFNRQGLYKTAKWWRANHSDGEWDTNLADKLTAANVKFAYTSKKGDVNFLRQACNTSRGCGVAVMGGKHFVLLVHLDDKWAGIIDNNDERKVIWVPAKIFINEWLNSTSWAVTILSGTPAAPLP